MEEELTGKGVGLPPEIMHDILSRLPVKPLCRFKLVSKAWLSLISDTNFITMHSKAVENNQNLLFQRRRVLFSDRGRYGRSCRLYSLDLDQFLDDVDFPVITRLSFPQHRPFRCNMRLINCSLSCNGLLLVEDDSAEYYLVNPLGMKNSKKLPPPPKKDEELYSSFGLGFDYSTNEHKVVILVSVSDYRVAFNVYTLKTDLWRPAGSLDYSLPTTMTSRFDDAVLVNGGVHWLMSSDNEEGGRLSELISILGFMITSEKIVTISLPEILAGIEEIELGVFRDQLCLTLRSQDSIEFWVMKEYGIEESWTKMRVSFPYDTLSHMEFRRGSYDLLLIKNDVTSSPFVMYNFDDDEYWTLPPITHFGRDFRFDSVGVFVESLASVITHAPSKNSNSSGKRKRKQGSKGGKRNKRKSCTMKCAVRFL